MRRFIVSFLEILEVVVIAVGAVFLIRYFLVQPFLVSGASMVPNFRDGDYLLVDELTYRIRDPGRGEVAVFHYPNDRSTFFIKRIIGLPGEEIRIHDNSVVVVNELYPDGFDLQEPYLLPDTLTSGDYDIELGEDEYYLLGDNRLYSYDSRAWGALTRDELVGVARLRLWPIKEATVLAAPQYAY